MSNQNTNTHCDKANEEDTTNTQSIINSETRTHHLLSGGSSPSCPTAKTMVRSSQESHRMSTDLLNTSEGARSASQNMRRIRTK